MKKLVLLLAFALFMRFHVSAQIYTVETIQYNGDKNNLLDLIILGDGYTAAEQGKMTTGITNFVNYLFGQEPWSNYRNYFNIYAIKVVSNQSGITHPYTTVDCSYSDAPPSSADTQLGCSFDIAGIHRLVTPTKDFYNILADNFPEYDHIVVLSNTSAYGGSGGWYATITNHYYSGELAAHELGHSFAGLADEYYAGEQYFFEKPNMTQQSDPLLIKWKNWIGADGIGIYPYGNFGNPTTWFKPSFNCKMEVLGANYCSVCKENIIEKIHRSTSHIIEYTPASGTPIESSSSRYLDFQFTKLLKPIPNTLKIEWKLDGVVVSENSESYTIDQNLLLPGNHILTANVDDVSSFLRVDNHSTLHSENLVTWNINSSPLPVKLVEFKTDVYENTNIIAQWKTAEESKFDHFELQRSTNPAEDFKRLAEIKGKNHVGSTYSYIDKSADAGIIWYYRLKMVDSDGTFAYSKISASLIEGDGLVSIYPNPAVNKEVNIKSPYKIEKIELINKTGNSILTQNTYQQKRATIGMSDLESGIYLMKILGSNGTREIKKIIVE